MMDQRPAGPSFEEAYESLRKAVEELESGALPLEAAIARYEDAMRLARLCNDILDRAELRIERLGGTPGGEPLGPP